MKKFRGAAIFAIVLLIGVLAGCSSGKLEAVPADSEESSTSVGTGTVETKPDTPKPIIYENADYGFRFSLPESWKGYTIVTDQWEGLSIGDSQAGKAVETGPKLSIRHPEWTSEKPRQDIPILILTLSQWEVLDQENGFHIGAAPMGPSELGRNAGYVLALPARYNFEFSEGYEEVETILKGHPLQPTAVSTID